jgi:sugar O-acyltransferase (sialic acid O-acetyltransferase NeuD family)
MTKKILLIGGGGHCSSIIDSLKKLGVYDTISIVDKNMKKGGNINGIKVVGNDNDLHELFLGGYKYAFISLGSTGNSANRIRLYEVIKHTGFIIPNIIDADSILSSSITLSDGIYIGKGAIINTGATIQSNAIINTGAIVEHDCVVGESTHIASGAVLGGNVVIGVHTHIGSNSTIKNSVKIGSNSVIGIGSVVTKDINDNVVAYGVPAKEVKKNDENLHNS